MKKIIVTTIVLSVACIMLIISCTKEGPTGATGLQGPAGNSTLTTNIEGLVFLYDDGNNKITAPASLLAGDTVVITNSMGVTYRTTTSTTGSYSFTNVSTGTYSGTVSKPGYGTTKLFGAQFVGGGTLYHNFNLSQLPTTNVIAAQTTTTGSAVAVSYTVPSSPEETWIIIYVSLPGNNFVNGTLGNYSFNFNGIFIQPNNTSVSTTYSANLYELGFTSGSTVYFASYIYGPYSYYTDPTTGLNVYTALSSTPVITSAIVP